MIDEPGCSAGSVISPRPPRGPDDKQAQVIGDLHQVGGQGPRAAAGGDDGVTAAQRLEVVHGSSQDQAGSVVDRGEGEGGERGVGVDAGADRGAAQRRLLPGLAATASSVTAVFDHAGVAGEFLAEPHRRRILKVRAADLDDVVELVRLGEQRRRAARPVRARASRRRSDQGGEVDRGREDVVARLAEVDVVVGMDGRLRVLLPGEEFVGPLGDDLVGVHVARCARTGLEDIDDELTVEPAFHDLVGGAEDGVGILVGQQPELAIGDGRRPFDQTKRTNDFNGNAAVTDRKKFHRPSRLRTVIHIVRNGNGAEAVGFNVFARQGTGG